MANAGNVLQGIGTALGGISQSLSLYDQAMENKKRLAAQQEDLAMQKEQLAEKRKLIASQAVASIIINVATFASLSPETGLKILMDNRKDLTDMADKAGMPLKINFDGISKSKTLAEATSTAFAMAAPVLKRIQENSAQGKDPFLGVTADDVTTLQLLGAHTGEGWMVPLMQHLNTVSGEVQARQAKDAKLVAKGLENKNTRKTQNAIEQTFPGQTKESLAAAATMNVEGTPLAGSTPEKPKFGLQKEASKTKPEVAANSKMLSKIEYFEKSEGYGKPLLIMRTQAQKAKALLNKNDLTQAAPMVELMLAAAFNQGRPTDPDAERVAQNPSVASAVKRWWSRKVDNKDWKPDREQLQVLTSALSDWSDARLKSGIFEYASGTADAIGVDPQFMQDSMLTRLGLKQKDTPQISKKEITDAKSWLNDPANKNDKRRAAVQARYDELIAGTK